MYQKHPRPRRSLPAVAFREGVLLEAQLIGEGRQALLWALGSWRLG